MEPSLSDGQQSSAIHYVIEVKQTLSETASKLCIFLRNW